MSQLPKVVLVALDGGTVAEGALPYADAVANALGACLRLVRVEPSRPPQSGGSQESARHRRAETYLEAMASSLNRRGAGVSTQVIVATQVSEGLAAAAEKADVALIAVASHGRGGVERWVEGSVAEQVADSCGTPVLLIVPSDLHRRDAVTFNRIMVPLDGTRPAEAAIPLAADIAAGAGATLLLVRVLNPMSAPGVLVPNEESWESERTKAATAYLDALRARLPQSLRSDGLVLLGRNAANNIERLAETERVDLTIMRSHGYSGLKRILMGSVADQVVRAGLPAILVRTGRHRRTKNPA